MIFDNTVTGNWSSGPSVILDNVRTFRDAGDGGLADGSSPWDGNEPALDGTGEHRGAGDAPALLDDTKNWIPGVWSGYWVYNITDGSQGLITTQTAQSLTAILSNGAENDWDPGDQYKITDGYPARDQIGRSTDQWLWTAAQPYPPQALEAAYFWNNQHNGSGISVYVHNQCGRHIHENRDFFNHTAKPGYQPYTYPHPLTLSDPLPEVPSPQGVVAYPNPYKPWSGRAQDRTNGIVFDGLPARCELKLFTLSGNPVFSHTKNDASPFDEWPIVNQAGQKVTSGVYVYVVTDLDTRRLCRGKVVIAK